MLKKLLLAGTILAQPLQAYDCNSDCGEAARFTYPCPTWRKPGRKCEGRNHAKFAACETEKAASCKVWNKAVDIFTPLVKPILEPNFNSSTYQNAVDNNEETEYVILCEAAGIAACGAVGAEYGGPWGAAASGAIGVFVSHQICIQSTKW